MSTAVYLRVSSKSQSVRSQKQEVQHYLDGNGIDDVRWFIDEGVSGTIAERPALRKLKLAIFNGEVRCVILYRLDRLARNIRDGINILTDWIGRDVRIVIVTMQIDLSGSLGQTIAALLLGLAQMERESIRERQAAGIAAAKARGKQWGGRKRGTFKADPMRIRELREKGLRHDEIAQALGISRRTVARMLFVSNGNDRDST